jgi:Zn-finger nucleic acid-binding protein
MQCPIDGTTLVMTDRQGVEIDYCPECRGVWLDRGELDKIIERSAPAAGGAPADDRPRQQAAPRKRRGSFLDDIFDF